MLILSFLGPIEFCKGPIKITKGPFKFGNLHVFECGMGHWLILRAHHHFPESKRDCFKLSSAYFIENNALGHSTENSIAK